MTTIRKAYQGEEACGMTAQIGLTKQQSRALSFVRNYIDTFHCSPSFDEVRIALRLASKSGVHRILKGLEARGYLEVPRGKKRALRVIDPKPFDEYCPHCGGPLS